MAQCCVLHAAMLDLAVSPGAEKLMVALVQGVVRNPTLMDDDDRAVPVGF